MMTGIYRVLTAAVMMCMTVPRMHAIIYMTDRDVAQMQTNVDNSISAQQTALNRIKMDSVRVKDKGIHKEEQDDITTIRITLEQYDKSKAEAQEKEEQHGWYSNPLQTLYGTLPGSSKKQKEDSVKWYTKLQKLVSKAQNNMLRVEIVMEHKMLSDRDSATEKRVQA